MTNTSATGATGVVVTSALPSGATFGACAVSQGTCVSGAGVITATFGSLAGSATAMLTVSATPTVAGPTTWTFFAAGNEPDGVSANDSATANATVLSSADLGVTVTLPSQVVGGGTLTYTVMVSNNGGSPAQSPVVTMTLPVSATFVSASGTNWQCNQASGVITCAYQLAQMSVGAAPNIAVVITAPTVSTMLQVSSGITSLTYDPVGTNNKAEASVVVDPFYYVRLPIVVRGK